jgi:heat shock protein HtpX
VEELAVRAGIPKPRVCVIPAQYANAFATGRNPQNGVVAVTEGIMRTLSERELRGVLAHEIAHIKNRDVLIATIAAMFAMAISSIGHMLQWAAMFGGTRSSDEEQGSGLQTIILAIFTPFAATLVQLAISRSREYLADENGAAFSSDPEALASALQKLHLQAESYPQLAAQASTATAALCIVNPFAGIGGLLNLFSTHPPIEERIERLLAMARNPQRFLRAAGS